MERTETLYFREGNSDKLYTLELKALDGGRYSVTAIYGRRGGAMSTQVKTPAGGAALSEAENVFERVKKEKVAKGYRLGEQATPFVVQRAIAPVQTVTPGLPEGLPASNFRPMLLKPIEGKPERYLRDDRWCLQQKCDGVRAIIEVGAEVRTASRTDKPVAISAAAAAELNQLCHHGLAILDTEVIGDQVVVFDLLLYLGRDLRDAIASYRLQRLEGLFAGVKTPHVHMIQTARTTEQKTRAAALLHEKGAEGVVFKDLSAYYETGRSNHALKWKFKAAASVIVDRQHGDKTSVEVKLFDGTPLGCVTIPGNQAVPPAGAIIEVEYLYAYRNGSLVQAAYKGVREDVEPTACTAEQLQYKGESR